MFLKSRTGAHFLHFTDQNEFDNFFCIQPSRHMVIIVFAAIND